MPWKKVKRKCGWCGRYAMMGWPTKIKYCSKRCYFEKLASNTEIRICLTCGKKFKVMLSMIDKGWGKGIYCSHECYWKGRKTETYKVSKIKVGLRKRGKNHWNWKGGIIKGRKERNLKEYKEWRRVVFERDGYACQDCRIKNKEGLGKTVKLEIDHIKPWAIYPESRYDVSNGRTLCQECHYKRKKETMKEIINKKVETIKQ